MRTALAGQLDAMMDKLRTHGEPDNAKWEQLLGWQDDDEAKWEDNLIDKHGRTGLNVACDTYHANILLGRLATHFNVPAITMLVEREFAGETRGHQAEYNPAWRAGNPDTIKTAATRLTKRELLHEFTHHWLTTAFLFNPNQDGNPSGVLTDHGGVFVRAYIELMACYFGINMQQLMDEAREQSLFVADESIVGHWHRWMALDFAMDGEPQRKAIRELSALDQPPV